MKDQTRIKKESLSKAELISSMADLSGLSKADSTRALDAMTHSIQTELSQGKELFQGKVSNVHPLITFQGKSLETLRLSFQDAVNEHIAWRKKYGAESENPSPELS